MQIFVHQINSHIGNLAQNAKTIVEATNASPPGSVSVFPELALCGYPPRDLADMEWFLDAVHTKIADMQKTLLPDRLCLFGSILRSPHSDGKKTQNVCIGIANNTIIHQQAKFLLPSYNVFDETRNFEAARTHSLVEWQGIRIATAICEDIWGEASGLYQRSPIPRILQNNPDLLIVLSSSPYTKYKRNERELIVERIAKTYSIGLCYCNAVGASDGIVFDGCSIVSDAQGAIIARAPACTVARISLNLTSASGSISNLDGKKNTPHQESASTRNTVINLSDISAESHTTPLQNLSKKKAPHHSPLPSEPRPPFLHEAACQEVLEVLCLGIRDFCVKNGFSRIHLGLSGGVDSALVATLATLALGADAVHVLLMPSLFSSKGSIYDAQQLAQILGIQSAMFPIHEIYHRLSQTFETRFAIEHTLSLVHENLQARVRGTILMAYANEYHSLLLTTGNKSELSVGYCTLYGDMCGGLAPIADLYKTEIYTLYRYIQQNIVALPESIAQKSPSAELRPEQTDQDSLPPYDQLDAILHAFIEERKSAAEILAAGFDPAMLKKVVSLTARAEFKRFQAPPLIKISPVSFGDGRKIPITSLLHFFEN